MPTPTERRRRDRLHFTTAVLAALALVITLVTSYTTLHNRADLLDQRTGRGIAISVTCATTSAVIEAGRATINGGSGQLSHEFEANLERLGFPPRPRRRAAARAASRAYAEAIAKRVEAVSGRTDLVRPDGSLNCERLKLAARG